MSSIRDEAQSRARQTAIALCFHGSRAPESMDEYRAIAYALAERLNGIEVATVFLDIGTPNVVDGLASLYARGYRDLRLVPSLLLAGGHASADLPAATAAFAAAHPDAKLTLCPAIGDRPGLAAAMKARITSLCGDLAPAECAFVLVTRGARAPEVSAWAERLAFGLAEELGFGAGIAAFSGIVPPALPKALEKAAIAHKRVVVAPYFLVAGRLVARIEADIDGARALFPKTDFRLAGHLGAHPHVIDALLATLTMEGQAA